MFDAEVSVDEEVRIRVTRGYDRLDAEVPGWDRGKDPDTLHVADPGNCPVALAHGGSYTAYRDRVRLTALEAHTHAFYQIPQDPADEDIVGYERLTTAWRREMRHRQAKRYRSIAA
ncbi:MAG TPA: hypothetical protein VFY28_03180 [Candidatus Paceibacterota bacterium]|nr:hypothetical protein [Candidatus Paceibacterota bacterium]